MTKAEVKSLQHDLNRFFERYLKNWPHLIADGDYGQLTRRAVRDAKWYIGWKKPNSGAPKSVGKLFRKHLDNPTGPLVLPSTKRRGRARRRYQHNHAYAPGGPGVGTFDGRKCAKAAIPILDWCRDNGWKGTLVSGWRDPWYSQQLCLNMCGHTSCPGLCAGLSSNHVGATPQRFAVDVSDYENFRRIVARCPVKPRIWNNLPRDRVHFSPSGN